MFDDNDKETFHAIRLLCDSIKEKQKPLLFWIGAGTSAWCSYPLWDQLADLFHSKFLKYESNYPKDRAIVFLESNEYPDFFGICRNTNPQRYFSILADSFKPKKPTPVYQRFIETVSQITPLHILTTNIDDLLETNLKGTSTVQRSDLERCISFITEGQSFVCKIHGSISSVESTVFTKDDYLALLNDKKYLSLIRHLFGDTMIVFIGYGLGDDYVLTLLQNSADLRDVFGEGPHFAVLSQQKAKLPQNVRSIRYEASQHKDHRSVIQVIDEVRCSHKRLGNEDTFNMTSKPGPIVSAHMISDIYPAGTWKTSHNLELTSEDGARTKKIFIGHGLTTSEMPITQPTAMHDLVMGLICFDLIYAPLSALKKVHELLGSDSFWSLIESDSMRFVHWESHLGIIYPDKDSVTRGELASFQHYDKHYKQYTIEDIIRRHLLPVPGKESEAERKFRQLEKKIEVIDRSIEPPLPILTRGLLLRPSIRKLLGMSGGTQTTSIPQWMKFPVLRLANVIKIGATCNLLGIASTKLEFGSATLAEPAFAAASGAVSSDEMASYVFSGRFDTDLGSFILRNPSILKIILKFRESQESIALRKEILDHLSYQRGSDFVTSVNAGLKSAIPVKALQAAHDKLSGLLIAKGGAYRVTPAVWNNAKYSEQALSLWRVRSAKELKQYCAANNIDKYDQCPCGSGEKLRFCCEEALKS